jgi:cytochrome c peroxidase
VAVAVALASTLAACGGGGNGAAPQGLSPAATAGKQLFFDTSLSASGKQSCGTCHVPARAFTADPATDQGLPVPLGGANMDLPGFRNAPSLMYASFTPPFDGVNLIGGYFRDGRASSLAVQAEQPFVTPFEMANANSAAVVALLQQSPASLKAFISVYGSEVLGDPNTALQDIGQAIAAYESEDPQFRPFSSKFDFYLAGQAQLTTQEQQGLALFNNPVKGNCTACHPSQRQGYSDHALFTDFSYDNIGIPRNWNIPANSPNPISPVDGVPLTYVPPQTNVPGDAEYGYYDMGLCGPFAPPDNDPNPRVSLTTTTTVCGQFKVPTLRNIALTAPYFHNGRFSTLQQVVEWYVTRDVNNNPDNNPTPVAAGSADGNPYQAVGTFYTAADGTPDSLEYNDLPVDYDANVNIGEIPYTPPTIGGGQAPTLDAQEIEAIISFLCTLTDGYEPANPAAYNVPAQCTAPVTVVTPSATGTAQTYAAVPLAAASAH